MCSRHTNPPRVGVPETEPAFAPIDTSSQLTLKDAWCIPLGAAWVIGLERLSVQAISSTRSGAGRPLVLGRDMERGMAVAWRRVGQLK